MLLIKTKKVKENFADNHAFIILRALTVEHIFRSTLSFQHEWNEV